MSLAKTYVLDADSFIRSKRSHYAFDFCPGYWDALLAAYHKGRVISIEPVKQELERGRDDLSAWVANSTPNGFFAGVTDKIVLEANRAVNQATNAKSQYTTAAKQEFARGADPWLVAYARVFGSVICTYEVASPESKARIKLPDVAREFEVVCEPPYEMLRSLGANLILANPKRL